MPEIVYRKSGPVFDGRALAAVNELVSDVVEQLGKEAKAEVLEELGGSLQHPTGFYESQVQVTSTRTQAVVNDGGVIYGPWLEGTGSRNATTRFKGYASFRKAADRIKAKAYRLAAAELGKYIGRMN